MTISLNDYQESAKKTAVYPKNYWLVYPALGLAGESGEYVDKVKKILRNAIDPDDNTKGVPIEQLPDRVSTEDAYALAMELGDVLWYLAVSADELGYTLDEIADMNLTKLADRAKRQVLRGVGDNR